METVASPPVVRPPQVGQATDLIPTYVYAVVFASLCIVWGLIWDISWHMSIGRDGLFSPPHLLIYVGAVVAGLFSGYQILSLTFSKNSLVKKGYVPFWGVFYGSLGAMYCVWGALTMLTSAPFDDWWHNTYGLDVEILTPPHSVLALGILMVQFGAIIGVLARQNRSRDRVSASPAQARQVARLKWLFVVAAGLMLAVLYTLLSNEMGQWASHNSSYYLTAGIAFPFYLLAIARASLLRYPVTSIAVVYMLAMLLPSWVLPLFPATPRLGPVLNPVTHYQGFAFPLLLVVPGYALDVLLHRFQDKINDWGLALLAGAVFVALLVPVQWFFGEFLLTSPAARNWFFFADAWAYPNAADWKYRYAYAPWMRQSTLQFLQGIGYALIGAVLSARLGLLWGNWMKRVQR